VHTSVTISLVWTTLNHRAPLHLWVREMVYRLNARARKTADPSSGPGASR
jgi:hypothetical protein